MFDSHSIMLHLVGECKFSRNLAVKGGESGFDLLQLVLFVPRLGYDGLELRKD